MFSYFILVLASYSLTFGVINNPVMEELKVKLKNKSLKLDEESRKRYLLEKIIYLLNCYHCSGFWSSALLYYFIFDDSNIKNILINALAVSGIILMIQYKMANILLKNKKLNKEIGE